MDNLPRYFNYKGSTIYSNKIEIKNSMITGNTFSFSDSLVHFSNAEYISCIDKLYNNDSNTIFIFESTCNRDYDITGAKDILDSALEWNEYCYDIDIEKHTLVHFKYNYRDFFDSNKKMEDWYSDAIRRYTSTSSIVSEILLERRKLSQKELKIRKESRKFDNPVAIKYSIKYNK